MNEELAVKIRELAGVLSTLDDSTLYDEERFEVLDPAARAVVAAFQAEEQEEERPPENCILGAAVECLTCGCRTALTEDTTVVTWPTGGKNADLVIGNRVVMANGVCRACLDKEAKP